MGASIAPMGGGGGREGDRTQHQPPTPCTERPTELRGWLPLTRELSAKLTEGETGRAPRFIAAPAYLSLRLG